MYYYINTFYIYSFIGYIYELILNFTTKGKIINNLLTEPIKPIYGVGAIIIFTISVFILLTLFEYLTGIFSHKLLGKTLWNYKHKHFHIGKYICLEVSILWTILSLLYVFILKKKTDKIIKKIPEWFSNILIITTITDILLILIH